MSEAPAAVREAVSEMLCGPIRAERPSTAGFTPSIASVVAGPRGWLFVKAAPVGDGLGEAVAAGVVLAGVVGDLGPRLVGAAETGAWRVAAYEVIEGEAPRCTTATCGGTMCCGSRTADCASWTGVICGPRRDGSMSCA